MPVFSTAIFNSGAAFPRRTFHFDECNLLQSAIGKVEQPTGRGRFHERPYGARASALRDLSPQPVAERYSSAKAVEKKPFSISRPPGASELGRPM